MRLRRELDCSHRSLPRLTWRTRSEQIPLISTGFRLLLLFFPTFHVDVALDADVSPLTDLRVASAGVWHNVLLASVAWTWSDAGAGLADRIGRTLGLWDMLDEGVIVVAVDSVRSLLNCPT